MSVYTYDGSFEGFLTVLYETIKNNDEVSDISTDDSDTIDLFAQKINIKTDSKKAETVIKTLLSKFDYKVLRNVYYCFLSCDKSIEKKIYLYVKLCLKLEKNIDDYYSNDIILPIREIVKRVAVEKQKFLGILRFQKLKDDLYYAQIEPDNNIVFLLTNHCKKRFSSQEWLIHDVKRNVGAFYDTKTVKIISVESYDDIKKNYHEDEELYQNLWKTYFKNIAIEERKNLKLQRQFIPVRYWKYLVEKN
ncbi:MAG: hypothetical protein A2086_05380 [Spirochaetes bacterium GWD1_27_9]|nr:MAG: hypothetical protein A2Z98_08990 [Spirochaetes bacterium GWB1_27_13]OHD24913.1 MAG: hypothetical protein A2Y34_15225 [Spirochaetes bacterium GWC1_27_15]OHD31809.1 MAG: hypothetical protein A2086_05380 [Spirochaetes bacterium GWD1_27_9]